MKFINSENKYLVEKKDIAGYVRDQQPAVLLTMGAGDIELLADDVISALQNEQNR
jgi:UDP-N-acetylmuramate-alanine ligase